jgi:hypothetical protein
MTEVGVSMQGFSYYLHERAEDSRHNEAMGLLLAAIGSVFMMGGILQTVITVQRPDWFLIFPFETDSSPYGILSLSFTLLGVVVLLVGFGLGIYFAAQRSWYTSALKETYRAEEERLKAQKKAKENGFPTPPAGETIDPAQPYTGIPELRQSFDHGKKGM